MKQLIIAEKPSVAQNIAAALNVGVRKDGYIENDDYIISWCVGHLVGLAAADAYGEQYAKWNYDTLPILPKEWKYTVAADKGKQFKILKELMHRADVSEVINACDAGREGELIFRFVYHVANCKKPMRRLWISSMEADAIREGFSALKNGADYDALYSSALCRAKADWIIGINATRLFSYSFGYVAGWSSGREMSELKSSLETIRATAAEIIESIDTHLAELQKEREAEMPLIPDEHTTGEKITTPRGSFSVTDMTREQMEAAGYGVHHTSKDGKHLIMGNGTNAFAVTAEQPTEKETPLKHVEDTIEQNDNSFDGIINNTPTVDELEAKVKAGETISLIALANAIKAEQKGGKGKPKEEKQSIRAQLKKDAGKEKAAPKKAATKKKDNDLEV